MHELQGLTEVFKIQDTLRFQSTEDFLESYKHTGGEMTIADDGTIHRNINPELANITLQEALEKSGKSGLYVAEEGRVYESPMYLNWHRKYEQSLNDSMKETISDITPYKDNVDGFIRFFLQCVVDQCTRNIGRIEKINKVYDEDEEIIKNNIKGSIVLKMHPIIMKKIVFTAQEMANELGVHFNSINGILNKMVELNIVVKENKEGTNRMTYRYIRIYDTFVEQI